MKDWKSRMAPEGTGCDLWRGSRIVSRDMENTEAYQEEMLTCAFSTSQSPEIQTMYSLNMPISAIRTKIRQEFERHRYVNQLKTTDVLLFNSHQEFQVSVHSSSRDRDNLAPSISKSRSKIQIR
jgi:hypothetical protein